jgi:hypothetical protein
LSSLIPENLQTPFITEAMINKRGNSSIAEETNFFGQLIGFNEPLLTKILPTYSPDFFFKFFILIFAFIFFKILIKPIRVGLQLTFLINNFDPVVNKVRTINGAAEDGSP